MPSFICPFCSLNCSGLLPGSDGKSVADINWLCKAGKTALQQAVDQSHSPEIDGIPVNWEDGFINSQNQISAARFPLVIISGEVSCETQQLGLQLAGLINAVVDTPQSRYQGIASQWVQEVGSQTFTLGETKASQAAHLYWGIDPGDHIPCPHEWVLNSIQRPSTLEINYQAKQGWGCSHAIVIEPGSTLTLLQKARLALRTTNKAGEPLVNQLLDFFQSVDSGVVFIGSRFLQEGGYALLELQRLLEDLWEKHAWRSLLFDFEANSTGGGEALTARTGFSQSVLTAVQPQDRKSSVASAQELIDKKQTDLVILVGTANWLPPQRDEIPTIVLNSRKPDHRYMAWLPSGQVGIHHPGTVLRFDGVPLHLDAFEKTDTPSMEKILERLIEGVLK